MNVKQLLEHWQDEGGNGRDYEDFNVRIPIRDAARIHALADLFPEQGESRIVADLIESALRQLLDEIPYVKGDKVVAEDEMGDPIFEDAGLTPRLHSLTDKHFKALRDQRNH